MRRLGIGIVGLGRGATLTVPAFIGHARCLVVAGADPDPAARAGFAAATGARAVTDLDALLADPAVEAVYVASPHELHAVHAIAALRAGRPVLVEKPMAVTLAQGLAMVEAADEEGRVLMVGPSHGYDPPVTLAAALAGGEARLIQLSNHTDFLYRPRRPAELDRGAGGGVVFSQASHQIDIARRIAAGPVVGVRGWVDGWDAARPTDAGYAAMLFFANGAVASLTYAGVARYDSDALAGWVGEMGASKSPDTHSRTRAAAARRDETAAKVARGYAAAPATAAAPQHHERFGQAIVSCRHADLELVPDGVVVHDAHSAVLHRAPLPPVGRYAVADLFVRAVLDGEAPVFDGRWGLETLACCHALLRSADEGHDVVPADLIAELESRR